MNKAEIATQIEVKQARLTALKESEHISMMSDDFYYRNGGDKEIRQLTQEIQDLKASAVTEDIPADVVAKAAEMYADFNGGVLETAGTYIFNYWIDAAKESIAMVS